MTTVADIANAKPAIQLNLLVVDDEPDLVELVRDVAVGRLHCKTICAFSVEQARKMIAAEAIDVLVTDLHLPDGDGLELLPLLRQQRPSAEAIVITGNPSVGKAVGAMRNGAADFLAKPFSADNLTDRVKAALERRLDRQQRDNRQATLRKAVRKLNEARKLVSKKVDLLCNDLIGAYTDLSKQFDVVRLQHGYKQFVGQPADLEQLLCHTMDWLLRQLGYANVGIWLASAEGELNLGAYMKYTVNGDKKVTDSLEKNILRTVMRKGFVRINAKEGRELLTPAEAEFLGNQDVLGVNATYLGDTLAAIILFRDERSPFTDDDIAALKTISPLFAVSLTSAVHAAGGADEHDASYDAGPEDGGATPPKNPKRKPKNDPADWWKRGEESPF